MASPSGRPELGDGTDGQTAAARCPLRLKHASTEQPFRHHDCRFYLRCLDDACAGRWESWSCVGCGAFQAGPRDEMSNNRGHDY